MKERYALAALIAAAAGALVVRGLARWGGGSTTDDRVTVAWLPDETTLVYRPAAGDAAIGRLQQAIETAAAALEAKARVPNREGLTQLVGDHLGVILRPDQSAWIAFTREHGGRLDAVAVDPDIGPDGRPTKALMDRWEQSASLTRNISIATDAVAARFRQSDMDDQSGPYARVAAFTRGIYDGCDPARDTLVEFIVPIISSDSIASESDTRRVFYGLTYCWRESARRWRPHEGWMYSTTPAQGTFMGPLF